MKSITVSTIIAVLLVVLAFTFTSSRNQVDSSVKDVGGIKAVPTQNVSTVDGLQVIEISVKGGYHPKKSTAKAGMPTMIRFRTDNTFDCSSSVRIPSMNISKSFPHTGTTDIDVGVQKVTTLQGTCGMGMYRFEVDFQG
jgi:P-type Cu+ transporter